MLQGADVREAQTYRHFTNIRGLIVRTSLSAILGRVRSTETTKCDRGLDSRQSTGRVFPHRNPLEVIGGGNYEMSAKHPIEVVRRYVYIENRGL